MRHQETSGRCHLLQASDGGGEETGLMPNDSSTGPVDEQWAAVCGDEPGHGTKGHCVPWSTTAWGEGRPSSVPPTPEASPVRMFPAV